MMTSFDQVKEYKKSKRFIAKLLSCDQAKVQAMIDSIIEQAVASKGEVSSESLVTTGLFNDLDTADVALSKISFWISSDNKIFSIEKQG